ncbi:MAG: hypothetical protein FWD97_04540 [Defluviitaleaceae bacterium]|nr:hypothetical protein [Defluviitaleaceae bacterium]
MSDDLHIFGKKIKDIKKATFFAVAGLIAMGIMFLVGLVLLVFAPQLGEESYRSVLFQIRHGHVYTTAYEYVALLEASLIAYRMVGLAVTTVGGIGFLLSGIGVYRELGIRRKNHGQSND